MAIEATLSGYKKNNTLITIAILAGSAAWLFYDGKYNENFIKKHTPDGTPDSTLNIHRKSPPYLLAGAALVGGYFFYIKSKKVIADENSLRVNRQKISYADIRSIDKTYFSKKGFFTINYSRNGMDCRLKISDRTYDNLQAVLEHLVAKIST